MTTPLSLDLDQHYEKRPTEDKLKIADYKISKLPEPLPIEDEYLHLFAAEVGVLKEVIIPCTIYQSKIFNTKMYGRYMILKHPTPTKIFETTFEPQYTFEVNRGWNVGGKIFLIKEILGRRSYKAYEKGNSNTYFFIKLEDVYRSGPQHPCMLREWRFLKNIKEKSLKHRKHFLEILDAEFVPLNGTTENRLVLAQTAFCDTLTDIMKRADGFFTQQTAIYIAAQTLEAVHDVHLHGYMHRDICPSNFLVGLNEKHRTIYITNFQTAIRFEYSKYAYDKPWQTKIRVKYETEKMRWRCRNYHHAGKSTRRDDVESWLYTVLEIFNPDFLPWRKISFAKDVNGNESERRMYEMKNQFFNFVYAKTWGMLRPFITTVIQYLESSTFYSSQVVDFAFLMSLLRELAIETRSDLHGPLDWEPSPDGTKNVIRKAIAGIRIKTRMLETEEAKKREKAKKERDAKNKKTAASKASVAKKSEVDVDYASDVKKDVSDVKKKPSTSRNKEGGEKYYTAETHIKKKKDTTKALRDLDRTQAASDAPEDLPSKKQQQEDQDHGKSPSVIERTQDDGEPVKQKKKTTIRVKKNRGEAPDEAETPMNSPGKKKKGQEPEESATPVKTPDEHSKVSKNIFLNE